METFEFPVPILVVQIAAIVGIVYAIKAVVDARVRTRLIASNPSDALVHALTSEQKELQRRAALRWGIVLVFLAVAFAVIEAQDHDFVSPGVLAWLFGATGIGNLVFFVIDSLARRKNPRAIDTTNAP